MEDIRFAKIIAECENIAAMKAHLKQQAMIYQRDAKVEEAKNRGLPFDAFFEMPYSEWSKIRGQ